MKKNYLTLLLLIPTYTLLAQNDSIKTQGLEEVIITISAKKYAEKKSDDASKLPIKNLENSQVYTVLPKELMAEQLVTDYQTALQRAPGLSNITYGAGGGGVGLNAMSRGFSTFAGAIRNGTATNFVTLADPFNTESIEVIKGPSGTLYGSTLVSYGGLINRVTKKPYNKLAGEISYTTGQWNNNRLTTDVNIPINENLYSRFNLLYQKEGSFQDYGKSNAYGISPSFTYKISEKLTIDLEAEIYSTNRNSTFIGLGKGNFSEIKFNDLNIDPKFSYASNDILTNIKSFNVFGKATYKISDKWTSYTLYSAANAENNTNYLFLNINADNTLSRNYMHVPSVFNAFNIQQNFNGNFYTGDIKHRFLIGFDYTRNASNDKRYRIFPIDIVKLNEEPPYISKNMYNNKLPQNPYTSNIKDKRTTGLYLTDVINLLDNLIIMGSLRVDLYRDKSESGISPTVVKENFRQTAILPKFGIVYQPIKKILSLFANYQTGFNNNLPQIISETNEVIDFKPEYAKQLEAGIKTEFLNGRFAATISYYDIKVTDIIRPNPENILYSIQDGERLSKGFEADIITSPINGWELILGYGYNDSKYTKASSNIEGRRPYGVPKQVGNFWTSYRIIKGKFKGVGLGIGGNFQSDMYFSDSSDLKVNGYCKFDASAFYENKKVRLGLKLNNLTNKEYFLVNYWGQFQNPRQFLANLTIKF